MTSAELIATIRNEIEKRITDNTFGAKLELIDILAWLDTLESEKPMNQNGLEEEIDRVWKACEPVDEGMGVETANIHIEQFDYLARHFAKWGAEHLADARKTSLNDLDEAANNYLDGVYGKMPHSDYHIAIFIAGAKWQEEQLLKSSPLPEDPVLFNKGVAEGRRLAEEEQADLFTIVALDAAQRAQEQMMKEAVEGEVVKDINNKLAVTAKNVNLDNFKFGDKVRVIVLKKED